METSQATTSFVTKEDYRTEEGFGFAEEHEVNKSPELLCFDEPQASEYTNYFQMILLLILTTFCITSNSLVIYIIISNKKLLTPNNAFILSLAISDLLYGISFALYNLAHVEFAQKALGKQRFFFSQRRFFNILQ